MRIGPQFSGNLVTQSRRPKLFTRGVGEGVLANLRFSPGKSTPMPEIFDAVQHGSVSYSQRYPQVILLESKLEMSILQIGRDCG